MGTAFLLQPAIRHGGEGGCLRVAAYAAMAAMAAMTAGCVLPDAAPVQDVRTAPRAWRQPATPGPVAAGWVARFGEPRLERLVARASERNHRLAQHAAVVAQAEQAVIAAGGARQPRVELSLSRERRFNDRAARHVAAGALSLELDADPWRRLSDTVRHAELTLAAERNAYRAAALQLAADVCRAWFDLREAEQLLVLFRQRLDNLQANLEIVEQRYNAGLNPALDLYLARNNLEAERAALAAREESRGRRARELERLLGDAYPGGTLTAGGGPLPDPPPVPAAGLPSELLTRRPDLEAAWLQLLAAHAGLAVAYRNRFPSLRLTGRLRSTARQLDGLLDSGLLSLAASAGQTLFDAGILKAEEQRARLEVRRLERVWRDRVHAAFAEVENALQASRSATMQYAFQQRARDSAERAEAQSLERYRRGLESYTTVLEAERRAFDARTRLIELQNRLLQSRVALSRSLGVGYAVEDSE